jgi:hypothetical protein
MSETLVPDLKRVTIGDVIGGVERTLGDEGLEYLQTLLELLGLVARTDSIEDKSKSGRDAAIYSELWLKVQREAVRAAREGNTAS